MSKFLNGEKVLVKSIVAKLTIKRIPDIDIIKNISEQTNGKTITLRYLSTVKQQIKRESYYWYSKLREGEFEYLHEFKERIKPRYIIEFK